MSELRTLSDQELIEGFKNAFRLVSVSQGDEVTQANMKAHEAEVLRRLSRVPAKEPAETGC